MVARRRGRLAPDLAHLPDAWPWHPSGLPTWPWCRRTAGDRAGLTGRASGGPTNGRSAPDGLGSRPAADRASWGRAGPGQATPVPASGPLLPAAREAWHGHQPTSPRPAAPPRSLLILEPSRRSPQVVGACWY